MSALLQPNSSQVPAEKIHATNFPWKVDPWQLPVLSIIITLYFLPVCWDNIALQI